MGNAREEFGMNDNDRWEVFVLEYANSHEPWAGLVSGMSDAGMVDLPFSFVVSWSNHERTPGVAALTALRQAQGERCGQHSHAPTCLS